MAIYKASKARFDADPDFKKKAQLEVVEIQKGKSTKFKSLGNHLRYISQSLSTNLRFARYKNYRTGRIFL